MSQTKLTPLPDQYEGRDFSFDVCCWFDKNRPALESIIKQQQEPQAMTGEPEPVFKLQERSLESKVNWLMEKVGLLMAYKVMEPPTGEQPEPVTRGEVAELRKRIESVGELFHEIQNSLGRLRAEVVALDRNDSACMCSILERLDALEARQPQTPEPKPKCRLCGDKQIIQFRDAKPPRYCPACVKVGEVVSAEVANLLPVGSRTQPEEYKGDSYSEKVVGDKWYCKIDNDYGQLDGRPRRILRIGPAPATTDAPDKAEEIAQDLCVMLMKDFGVGSGHLRLSISSLLHKHGVGQPPPLADLIADPRLRPVVEVVKAALQLIESCNRNDAFMFEANGAPDFINKAVDALPPELREILEGVA